MSCPVASSKCGCNIGPFIIYHDEAYCGCCILTTKSFCCECGQPYCCFGYEPKTRNEPCEECRTRRAERATCEKDHSCKGGCGVRFCTENREDGITYQDPPRHRPGRKNRKFRSWCDACYRRRDEILAARLSAEP